MDGDEKLEGCDKDPGTLIDLVNRIPDVSGRNSVFKMIETWLGVPLTPDVESDPLYRDAIKGAVLLMRHKAFDWSFDDIDERWIYYVSSHKRRNCVYYAIRFSTTMRQMITFGWIASRLEYKPDGTKRVRLTYKKIRFIYKDGLFLPQYEADKPENYMTLNDVIESFVTESNKIADNMYSSVDIKAMKLNKFRKTKLVGELKCYARAMAK